MASLLLFAVLCVVVVATLACASRADVSGVGMGLALSVGLTALLVRGGKQ